MIESKSGNYRSSNTGDDVHVMTVVHNNRVQRSLKISLPVTGDKIRNGAGSEIVDMLVNTLHIEEFCVDVFKAMLKCRRDYQFVTNDVIDINKNVSLECVWECEKSRKYITS